MKNYKYEINELIAREIVLAQIASDAGKYCYNKRVVVDGDTKTRHRGYASKAYHQIRAINMICSNKTNFKFYVEAKRDQNGYASTLVYFSYKNGDTRMQISFHNPWRCEEIKPYIGKGTVMRWDRKSSIETAKELVKIFNLHTEDLNIDSSSSDDGRRRRFTRNGRRFR